MNEDGRWVTLKNGTRVFIKKGETLVNALLNKERKNKKIETQKGEKRIDEHTLEHNGYYIKSPKPNVGYKYATLEEARYFFIYDKDDDDITHNTAGWINSIDEARNHIDFLKKMGIYK